MELKKRKCLFCRKIYTAKIKISRNGLLKGSKIISSVCCSKRCSDFLNEMILNRSYVMDLKNRWDFLVKKQKELKGK